MLLFIENSNDKVDKYAPPKMIYPQSDDITQRAVPICRVLVALFCVLHDPQYYMGGWKWRCVDR